MPVHNAVDSVSVMLDSVLKQAYPNFELIVVDDGSSDGTAKVIEKYRASDKRIRLVSKSQNEGVSAARNTGLELAEGDYITFVDADDRIDAAMYRKLIQAIEEHGCDMAMCRILYEYSNTGIREEEVLQIREGVLTDVEYQKIGRAKNIAIETEWSFVGCYEELDRFLKGYTTIVEMLNEVREGFAIDMDNRIATVFNGMGAFLPSKFVEQGTYDKDTLVDLIRRVRTANRKNVIVAGSQRAISKIADGTNANWISNAAKEELATNGVVVKNTGIGCDAIVIPDSFVPFTYDFAGTDDTLYVLPDEQIIKIFYEGDLRAKEAHEQDEHDQTIRIQFQHNVGVEVVTSDLFAKYTIA